MSSFLNEMFAAFVSQGLPRELFEQLRPWARKFGTSVLERSGPVVARRQSCAHVARSGTPCPRLAVVDCLGCGEAVCLGHAFVRNDARAVCADCVSAMTAATRERARPRGSKRRGKQRPWEPPPPPFDADWSAGQSRKELREAYAVFGLQDGAPFSDVQRRFRELSRECHPDRFVDATDKARAEERFKRVTAAYHVLERQRSAA